MKCYRTNGSFLNTFVAMEVGSWRSMASWISQLFSCNGDLVGFENVQGHCHVVEANCNNRWEKGNNVIVFAGPSFVLASGGKFRPLAGALALVCSVHRTLPGTRSTCSSTSRGNECQVPGFFTKSQVLLFHLPLHPQVHRYFNCLGIYCCCSDN